MLLNCKLKVIRCDKKNEKNMPVIVFHFLEESVQHSILVPVPHHLLRVRVVMKKVSSTGKLKAWLKLAVGMYLCFLFVSFDIVHLFDSIELLRWLVIKVLSTIVQNDADELFKQCTAIFKCD